MQTSIAIMSAVKVCWSKSIAHLQISQTSTAYWTNMVDAELHAQKYQREYKWLVIRFDILLLYMTLFCLCCVCEVSVVEAEQHSSKRQTHISTHMNLKRELPRQRAGHVFISLKLTRGCCLLPWRPAVIWYICPRCGHRASVPSLPALWCSSQS